MCRPGYYACPLFVRLFDSRLQHLGTSYLPPCVMCSPKPSRNAADTSSGKVVWRPLAITQRTGDIVEKYSSELAERTVRLLSDRVSCAGYTTAMTCPALPPPIAYIFTAFRNNGDKSSFCHATQVEMFRHWCRYIDLDALARRIDVMLTGEKIIPRTACIIILFQRFRATVSP